MALPIKNGKVTTAFGKEGPMWKTGRHEGADFAVPDGTPFFAMADGVVESVGTAWGKAYGVLANVFIHRESEIYQANASKTGGWEGTRTAAAPSSATAIFSRSFISTKPCVWPPRRAWTGCLKWQAGPSVKATLAGPSPVCGEFVHYSLDAKKRLHLTFSEKRKYTLAFTVISI